MEDFESVVKAHQKRVYNVCLRFCGNPEDSFDLTQEVFIKAWRNMDSFRGDSAVYTWLYRLASNTCTDFLRKKARRGVPAVSLDDAEFSLPDTRFEPAIALERKELAKALEDALNRLSPEHKQIVILRETAGLSYGEIAEALDIEEGTVKSRLARARLALRGDLMKYGNDSQDVTSKEQKSGKGGRTK
jgi:RNA polymerase sigma-70 factor (ECF subfamily)